MDNGQIILFQTQDGETKNEVRLVNETVWLTASQMAELFQRNRSTIQRHIKQSYDGHNAYICALDKKNLLNLQDIIQ